MAVFFRFLSCVFAFPFFGLGLLFFVLGRYLLWYGLRILDNQLAREFWRVSDVL